MSKKTPEQIAAALAKTTKGRNVRALLLRFADGESWPDFNEYVNHGDLVGEAEAAVRSAWRRKLMDAVSIKSIGRKVADACRPKPWSIRPLPWSVELQSDEWAVRGPSSRHIRCESRADAERIAALLTADDLARAKMFERDEP